MNEEVGKLNPIRGRILFSKYKSVLNTLTVFFRLFPMGFRKWAFERCRHILGKLGLGLRYAILKSICKSLGDNVAIYPDVYILNPQNIEIGNNVSIHPMCYIECLGGIVIGNDVSIAHGVTIMSTSHSYNDNPYINIREQNGKEAPVQIEDNVWIGAKASILCGVTVGGTSVIGINSVVLKSIERNSVYVGIPAKKIKDIDGKMMFEEDKSFV